MCTSCTSSRCETDVRKRIYQHHEIIGQVPSWNKWHTPSFEATRAVCVGYLLRAMALASKAADEGARMAEAAVADEEHEVLRPGGEEVNSMASPITAEEVRMMASPITSPRERPSPAGGPQEKVVVDPGLLLGMPMLVVEELFFEPEALLNLVRKVWIAKPRSIAEKFAYLRDEEEGETPRHHWLLQGCVTLASHG